MGLSMTDVGVFSNNLGTLIFTLDFDVPVGTAFALTFSLKNPPSEQVPVSPTVELQLVNEIPPILIPPQIAAKTSGARCCLSSFDRPRLITATVRESTTLPDELNVLYFSLHSNVPLKAAATTITILGMKNTQDEEHAVGRRDAPDLQLLDIGRLIFPVDVTMFDCSCISSCSQNRITFSVQVRNPLSRKEVAPRLLVRAVFAENNAGFEIPYSVVSGSVLQSQGA
ncbi:hypothetical protein T484DRAFT_1828996 [Baffinella frigidus]|nr:hypothetical protein T484DRAFT_1828996 [Cryptophyta sp. CCMP2293]